MRTKIPTFDPKQAPIVAHGQEPLIPPEHLNAFALRKCFAQATTWHTETPDESRLPPPHGRYTPAAVLIPLIVREHQLHVLLTERTAHLHHHAGQISFPGGRTDPEDAHPQATALRETQEEIGISSDLIEILGQLPIYHTGTGFEVTPIIGLIHPPFHLSPDHFEVAKVFEAPIDFLMNPNNHQKRRISFDNHSRHFYAMPYFNPEDKREYFIWGATAGILRNLYHFLAASFLFKSHG
jgi:8-oxo-dGTP pyrophosphatase MutT (NUDIX family)